jgi:ribosomal-protein-alanine N-acetyltransferase
MTEHDLLEVVEIEEACGLSRWGWDAYHAELRRPEAILLVTRGAVANGFSGSGINGFIVARRAADEVHINNIGVREPSRRAGIASALLRAALAQAAHAGARVAVLEVRARNVAAQALYRQHGFRITGRRRDYYKEPTEDALIMMAVLESTA